MRLYTKTHGCQMNEYDTKRMTDLLSEVYSVSKTDTPDDADLLILNTCSIREKAQEKVFSLLGTWRKIKEKRKDVVIAVAGCVASQEGEALRKRAPYVDLVFGPQTLHRLPKMLKELKAKNSPVVDISFPSIEKFDNLPAPRADGPAAFVSIQEGCSKYCSYCIVPYTRGEEIDRPFNDILAEIHELASQGVKEVTLLGQNVNAYKGQQENGTPGNLGLLIHYVAQINGIELIRFTTSHPLEFNDSLIEAYKNIPKLANHLHLPVQSGSDKVLMRMKRGHTALEFKAKIKKLRAVRPGISISSDFIVGFPDETEEDFAATIDLVKSCDLDLSFSFIYSKRPGTPAASYEDNIAPEIKKARLAKLQEVLRSQGSKFSEQMVDKTFKVLVTGKSRKDDNMLSGRTQNNRVVYFSGPNSLIGQIVPIIITRAAPNSLHGRLTNLEEKV